MTMSAIEWIGEVELRRDGYLIAGDQLLRGPVTVCAQTYPAGAALSARIDDVAMARVRDDAGPFANNTLWCAEIEVAGEQTLAIVAEDAAGAPIELAHAVTARDEIAIPATAASWRM